MIAVQVTLLLRRARPIVGVYQSTMIHFPVEALYQRKRRLQLLPRTRYDVRHGDASETSTETFVSHRFSNKSFDPV